MKKISLWTIVIVLTLSLVGSYALAGCAAEPVAEEPVAEEPVDDPVDEPEEITEAPEDPEEEAPPAEEAPQAVEDTFVYAILTGIDWDNGVIYIEQLEAEPYEEEVGPEIELADDPEVIRSVVIRKGEDMDDYEKNINLGQIPLNSEIGIEIKNNQATLLISQIYVDADNQDQRIEMEAGETFVYAILEWADYENKIIGIQQLINEPHEEEVGPQVTLAEGYRVQMSVVERHEDGEDEYIVDITLQDVPIGEEIGIILNEQGLARAIVYNINVEQ